MFKINQNILKFNCEWVIITYRIEECYKFQVSSIFFEFQQNNNNFCQRKYVSIFLNIKYSQKLRRINKFIMSSLKLNQFFLECSFV